LIETILERIIVNPTSLGITLGITMDKKKLSERDKMLKEHKALLEDIGKTLVMN